MSFHMYNQIKVGPKKQTSLQLALQTPFCLLHELILRLSSMQRSCRHVGSGLGMTVSSCGPGFTASSAAECQEEEQMENGKVAGRCCSGCGLGNQVIPQGWPSPQAGRACPAVSTQEN